MIDLISEAVGGAVVSCNDEFFAPAFNLIRFSDPVWKEDEYTEHGKWMDGWETRRRREPGHDWCEIALGLPGQIELVTVDTSYFTGNYPESFSLEACGVPIGSDLVGAEWTEIIPQTPLSGNASADFEVISNLRLTHVRLKIYPDGGVARLRVSGTPIPGMTDLCPADQPVNLASLMLKSEAVDASDMHYSHPTNLLRPTESQGMWDGWETKRRRGAGHDWVVVRLGVPGNIRTLIVDSSHFKGNAPGWVSVDVSDDGKSWRDVIERADIAPHDVASIELDDEVYAGFVRLNIHPDGGLARMRVLGTPDTRPASALCIEYLNALFREEARTLFATACASPRWVESMMGHRPFANSDDVLAAAEQVFEELDEEDWLEAFAGHPRIGERGDRMANREQAGASSGSGQTQEALTKVNQQYEQKFGFTFIVYASGKSADEMLEIARKRLGNTREQELAEAAQQQRSITTTRLRRMLCLESWS